MSAELALAYAAGLASSASGCVLPLLPVYLLYLGGTAPGRGEGGGRFRVIGNTLLFVAGFSTAFVALGAAAGLLGADLRPYRPLSLRIAGVTLALMGILLLVGSPLLMRQRRFEIAHRLPRRPLAFYLVGLAFAVGWTPCVGPFLAAVLVAAAAKGTATQGALLLTAYTLGMATPFVVAAPFAGTLTKALRRLRGLYPLLNAAAALTLVVAGLLIFSDRLTVINGILPPVAPVFESAAPPPSLAGSVAVASSSSLPVGSTAPDFSVVDVDGRRTSLHELRGRPVVLNFWATWCVPCRQELPLLAGAALAHRDDGVALIAVNYKEDPRRVRAFADELHLRPAPYLDPPGRVSSAYRVGTDSLGLPVTVFITREGRIGSYVPWALTEDGLARELAKII